jgi:hypothetical protein
MPFAASPWRRGERCARSVERFRWRAILSLAFWHRAERPRMRTRRHRGNGRRPHQARSHIFSECSFDARVDPLWPERGCSRRSYKTFPSAEPIPSRISCRQNAGLQENSAALWRCKSRYLVNGKGLTERDRDIGARPGAAALKFRSPNFPACQIDEPYCVGTGGVSRFCNGVHDFADFNSGLAEIRRIEHAAIENDRVGVRNSRVQKLITPEHRRKNGTRPTSEQFMFLRCWRWLMPKQHCGGLTCAQSFAQSPSHRSERDRAPILDLHLIV